MTPMIPLDPRLHISLCLVFDGSLVQYGDNTTRHSGSTTYLNVKIAYDFMLTFCGIQNKIIFQFSYSHNFKIRIDTIKKVINKKKSLTPVIHKVLGAGHQNRGTQYSCPFCPALSSVSVELPSTDVSGGKSDLTATSQNMLKYDLPDLDCQSN